MQFCLIKKLFKAHIIITKRLSFFVKEQNKNNSISICKYGSQHNVIFNLTSAHQKLCLHGIKTFSNVSID